MSEDDINRVKETLVCSTRLGKSKSAEYGAVEIKFIGENVDKIQAFTPPEKYTFVYAKSRLALIDENGSPSYDVKYILPNLSANNVDYEKTQIRISNFTPYNGARATKDYERACINKGSVITLKNLSDEQITELKNGVGAYLSEGFGEVLINPWFLNDGDAQERPIRLQNKEKEEQAHASLPIKSNLAKFLNQKKDAKDQALKIAEEVAKFIRDHKNKFNKISNSQWGAIRALCKSNPDIAEEVDQFISNGVAKDKWCDVKEVFINAIKESTLPLKFTMLVSMQMPKTRGDKE